LLDFPNEFGAPPSAARTLFSPRRRCEIRSNFDIVFALNTKRIFAIITLRSIVSIAYFNDRLWIQFEQSS